MICGNSSISNLAIGTRKNRGFLLSTPNHGGQLTNRADVISFTAENVGKKDGPARSIVGRWIIRPASSKMEFGIEFTSEKKFAMTLLQSQIEGTYRLSRNSLTLSYDRKNDRNEFEWIDDNQMRLTNGGQVFDCQRYDFGWPTRIVD